MVLLEAQSWEMALMAQDIVQIYSQPGVPIKNLELLQAL